jgi:hypothetical protein
MVASLRLTNGFCFLLVVVIQCCLVQNGKKYWLLHDQTQDLNDEGYANYHCVHFLHNPKHYFRPETKKWPGPRCVAGA